MRSSSCPARPTKGSPCSSSSAPGSLADEAERGVGVAAGEDGLGAGGVRGRNWCRWRLRGASAGRRTWRSAGAGAARGASGRGRGRGRGGADAGGRGRGRWRAVDAAARAASSPPGSRSPRCPSATRRTRAATPRSRRARRGRRCAHRASEPSALSVRSEHVTLMVAAIGLPSWSRAGLWCRRRAHCRAVAAEAVARVVQDVGQPLAEPSAPRLNLQHDARLVDLGGVGLGRERAAPFPAATEDGGVRAVRPDGRRGGGRGARAARDADRARPALAPRWCSCRSTTSSPPAYESAFPVTMVLPVRSTGSLGSGSAVSTLPACAGVGGGGGGASWGRRTRGRRGSSLCASWGGRRRRRRHLLAHHVDLGGGLGPLRLGAVHPRDDAARASSGRP